MTEAVTRRGFLGAGVLALLVASGVLAEPRHGERGARSPESRERLERGEQRFRKLPHEEQQRLREAEDRYRRMSPQQREALRERWRDMSDSERERYRRRVERNGD